MPPCMHTCMHRCMRGRARNATWPYQRALRVGGVAGQDILPYFWATAREVGSVTQAAGTGYLCIGLGSNKFLRDLHAKQTDKTPIAQRGDTRCISVGAGYYCMLRVYSGRENKNKRLSAPRAARWGRSLKRDKTPLPKIKARCNVALVLDLYITSL